MSILHFFNRRRKRPEIDAVTADRLALMHYRVRTLGDRVRGMNRWSAGYTLRTGRLA